MYRKFCAAVVSVCLLLCLMTTAAAADTATLTITPETAEVTAGSGNTEVTFTVSVAPPAGKEIGVFSFRLKPSGDMTLPTAFKIDNRKMISITSSELRYDSGTGKGVFQTFEYTPESCFFAAVGSSEGHRMTQAAQIMTITATIPAGSAGVYALDAEFTVAPDGSGETYIGKVVSTPVTVTTGDIGSVSGKAQQTGQKTVIVSDLDAPLTGQKPDTEISLTTEAAAPPEYTVSWYCDGAALTDDTFTPGHVYTVVIRVKTAGTFDTAVYTNAGYTVTRLSDTDLELRRSYYVEAAYTRELTEEEAESQLETLPGETPVSAEETAPVPAAEDTPASRASIALPVIIVLAAAGLAAVILQFTFPGGLKALFRRKEKSREEP